MQFSPSDHLYPWIDVEERDIVGSERDDRPPPLSRKTTSKIPTVRKSFSSLLNEDMARHKLYEKATRLMESAKVNKKLTSVDASEYEKIENRIRRAVKFADTRCRKARMGKVPFSEKQKNQWDRSTW